MFGNKLLFGIFIELSQLVYLKRCIGKPFAFEYKMYAFDFK
jgi:hypothetical protein